MFAIAHLLLIYVTFSLMLPPLILASLLVCNLVNWSYCGQVLPVTRSLDDDDCFKCICIASSECDTQVLCHSVGDVEVSNGLSLSNFFSLSNLLSLSNSSTFLMIPAFLISTIVVHTKFQESTGSKQEVLELIPTIRLISKNVSTTFIVQLKHSKDTLTNGQQIVTTMTN